MTVKSCCPVGTLTAWPARGGGVSGQPATEQLTLAPPCPLTLGHLLASPPKATISGPFLFTLLTGKSHAPGPHLTPTFFFSLIRSKAESPVFGVCPGPPEPTMQHPGTSTAISRVGHRPSHSRTETTASLTRLQRSHKGPQTGNISSVLIQTEQPLSWVKCKSKWAWGRTTA